MFTASEAIIMVDAKDQIWVAVIDSDLDAVKYFTNVSLYVKKLPRTIDNWRERFREKRVLFMNH